MKTVSIKNCKSEISKDMELTIAYLAWRVQQPESVIRKIYNDIRYENSIKRGI